ncbi:MAG: 4Fe-4S binding protein [Lentisphaerae bacterium]|nr:4Fe-4S binding protein [Lentisphaerota bacterium]OQC12565.1 MAG: Ferredoxin [Lentisphaerae bacterium ADurb.Bin082]
MKEVIGANKCIGCGVCIAVCPRQCISMQEDAEGFLQPVIDGSRCVDCGKCRQSCPQLSIRKDANRAPLLVRGGSARDPDLLKQASSGAIFPLLAKQVLSRGGVVFGAAFTSSLSVAHIRAETWVDCQRLFGSKYVQSDLGNIFSQVKEDLLNSRWVLFAGAPCQVAALRSYLASMDVTRLLCVDFICHGVPSPKLWRDYLAWLKQKYHSPVTGCSFRDKEHGWRAFSFAMQFADGRKLVQDHRDDLYFRLFVSNCCLRLTCYNCQYKTLGHIADITLGDFWGVWKKYPGLDDDRGTSLIFAHSSKGVEFLSAIAEELNWQDVDLKFSLKKNPPAIKSVSMPLARKTFFIDYPLVEFSSLIRWYAKKHTRMEKILCLFKKMLQQRRLEAIKSYSALE